MNRGATGAFGVLPADACTLSAAAGYGPDRITENLYDAAGQLRQIIRGLGTSVQEVYASYKYSANGKQVAVADADAGIAAGVANADALDASAAHAHQTNYAYDGFDYDQLGRPAWEQYETGAPAAKVSFSWSNEGDLLTLGHALQGTAGVSYTNAYTPAHQIASSALDNAAYRYVPPANGTDSYVPNALNQYASITPAGGVATSIGYDLKGNLASDGAFSFAYDAENKLITAAKTGTSVQYAYDPLGRCDGKTVNGTSTYFLSADADEIAEYDGAGTLDTTCIGRRRLVSVKSLLYLLGREPGAQIPK